MTKGIQLILSILFSGLLTSCDYIHNLMDDGDITEQSITVGTIKQIIVDAPCRIVLHNGESDVVLIKGMNRLLEELELVTDNETLSIQHAKKNYLQKSRLIEIGISARHLNKITANMATELIATEPIETEQLTIIMNGGSKFSEINLDIECHTMALHVYGINNIGNYYIGGLCNTSSFTLEGSVNIDAFNLESASVNVAHKSIGSCKVSPSDNLKVHTYSSGNTYYKGQPTIEHERIKVSYLHNTGNVIKIE